MPRMLDDRLPGIDAKRREIEGWPAMAKAHGWYERDDEVDAHLPYLNRDLGWDDKNWRATEHSFSLLLDRYVRPGMRVLEVGAAKAWAAQHLVPARVRVRGDGHPRRPGDRPRPRRVLRGAGRRVRPRPGRRRAPALRLGGLRRHVLRRRAPPRARPDGDGARDGARDPQGRLGLRAERGHARARRRRRRPRPGRRRRASASTSTCTRSTRTSGRSRAPASSCGGSSRRRATGSWPSGGSPAGCCGCRAWGAARRRSSPRPATATRASPSMPARAVPRLLW